MEVSEALQKRRSVRKYKDQPVSEADIDYLLHAAMSGPSACNKKPWMFYVITEAETVMKLRKASRFSNIQAPAAIVVCGDLKHALPLQLEAYWIQDCSAATENILLAAVDRGLGTVWCGIHPQKRAEKNVSEILSLPKHLIPLNIIWFGVPDEEPAPGDQYDEKRVQRI